MLTLRFLKLGNLKSFQKGKISQKRKHPRAKSLNLMRSTTYTGNAKEQVSNLLDISQEGLQFFSKGQIEPGTVLKITVNMAEKKKQIPIIAKVMWMRPAKEKGAGYQVGVSFLEMDSKDRDLIGDFMKQQEADLENESSI